MCDAGHPLKNLPTRNLIKSLYTDAADEDYSVARFSFRLGLGNQFGWSAQQAIEKYIKGALLLNGMNISELGHDLDRAFREVKKYRP